MKLLLKHNVFQGCNQSIRNYNGGSRNYSNSLWTLNMAVLVVVVVVPVSTPISPGRRRRNLGDTKNKNKYAHYIIICIIQCQKHTCGAERPNALQIR